MPFLQNPVKSNLKILFEIVFTSFAGVLSEFLYVLAAVELDFQLKLIFKSQFCIAFWTRKFKMSLSQHMKK